MKREREAILAALAQVEAALEEPTDARVDRAHAAVQALVVPLKDAIALADRLEDDELAGVLLNLRVRCDVLRAVLDTRQAR